MAPTQVRLVVTFSPKITGPEVCLAARHPSVAGNDQQFARMRRGSVGPRVRALRSALGMGAGDVFDSDVQERLIKHFQIPAGSGADGIITPGEAARLSLTGLVWT